jgi:hypothetical protein
VFGLCVSFVHLEVAILLVSTLKHPRCHLRHLEGGIQHVMIQGLMVDVCTGAKTHPRWSGGRHLITEQSGLGAV